MPRYLKSTNRRKMETVWVGPISRSLKWKMKSVIFVKIFRARVRTENVSPSTEEYYQLRQ